MASERAPHVSFAGPADAGFTLIELLIAVTLLAMLTALTFGGFRFGTRAWERTQAHIDHAAEMQIVQAFIRRRLSETAPVLRPDENAEREILFEGGPTSLRLVTIMPVHLEAGGYSLLDLSLNRGGSEGGLLLEWRPYTFALKTGTESDPDRRVLLPGLKELDFDYYGRHSEDDAVASWSREWMRKTRLPQLIRIRASFGLENIHQWPDLVVAPVVASRAGRRR